MSVMNELDQRERDHADEAAMCGARFIEDIPGGPPLPLLVGRIAPEGHTVLYGTGGSGKGTLSASWAVRLVRDGHVVLVVDYEHHPSEWARRIQSLGGLDLRPHAVVYVSPTSPEWRGPRGSIWEQDDALARVADHFGASVIIIDSTVLACGPADPMKPETAGQYAGAIVRLGRPTLSLTHVTKADDLRYPFGSVYWHNLARVSWSLGTSQDGLVLVNRKANSYRDRGRFGVRVEYAGDDLPTVLTEHPVRASVGDLIEEVLVGWKSPVEVVGILNDRRTDSEAPIKDDSVRAALARGAASGRFKVEGPAHQRRYSRAEGR